MEYAYTVLHFAVNVFTFSIIITLVAEHLRRLYLAGQLSWIPFSGSSVSSPRSLTLLNNVSGGTRSQESSGTPKSARTRRMTSPGGRFELSEELRKKLRLSQMMTWICVILSVIRSAEGLYLRLSSFHVFPGVCRTMALVLAVQLVWVKCSMYCVFVNRLELSFRNTFYEYRTRTIRILYLSIMISCIGLSIWTLFAVTPVLKHERFAPNGQRIAEDASRSAQNRRVQDCSVRLTTEYAVCSVLFDTGFMGTMVAMFVRPLRQMYARSESSSASRAGRSPSSVTSDNRNHSHTLIKESNVDLNQLEFRLLPLKYTVLTMTAELTTAVAVALVALGTVIGLAFDTPINVACLLFMSQVWADTYWVVCSPLLRSLHSCGLVSKDTDLNIRLMAEYFEDRAQRKRIEKLSFAPRVMASENVSVIVLDQSVPSHS